MPTTSQLKRLRANVSNPPGGEPGKMTKKEIMEIKDAGERQKAIAENHELFGF